MGWGRVVLDWVPQTRARQDTRLKCAFPGPFQHKGKYVSRIRKHRALYMPSIVLSGALAFLVCKHWIDYCGGLKRKEREKMCYRDRITISVQASIRLPCFVADASSF
eukprot:jgi/Botrbrau1/977/Bobra.114_1s0018.1